MRIAALLALALTACGASDDDAPPLPHAEDTPSIAPAAPSPSAPAQLAGAYELLEQVGPDGHPFTMPGSLLANLPGCIWARWGWEFGEDGRVAVSNRLLCRAPPDLPRSHGVCFAEVVSSVQWRPNGLVHATPTAASSRFVLLERHGEVRDTSVVSCNVRVPALDATFVDVVPGEAPNRPRELTLALADGGRIRLRAVDDPEVDYGALIDSLDR